MRRTWFRRRGLAPVPVRAALEDSLVDELLKAVTQPEPAVAPAPPEKPGHAYWVYCVVRSEWAAELAAGIDGIEAGSSVEALVEGHLAALLSRVPLAEYGDDELRRHLEDIAWLERRARAHEAVQQHAMRQGPLVPLRMCTIYRVLDRVRHVLRDQGERFTENLAAVWDCSEWGVKVFLDLRCIPEPSPAQPEAASATGADYLAGRQRERDRVSESHESSIQCAEDVHQAVSALARQARANPVQRAEAHGRDAEMVLNEAYLLEDHRIEELQSTVRELFERWAPHGLLVELTGPWPPYNFVSDSAGLIFMRAPVAPPSPPPDTPRASARDVALIDLIDRLLAGGVVLSGEVILAAADIDLVRVDLRALISSVPVSRGIR